MGHIFDGIRTSTIDTDETDLVNFMIESYIDAFCRKAKRFDALAKKQHPEERYCIALQVKWGECIDTRNVHWAIIPESDPNAGKLRWIPFDREREVLVHIRIFYGPQRKEAKLARTTRVLRWTMNEIKKRK